MALKDIKHLLEAPVRSEAPVWETLEHTADDLLRVAKALGQAAEQEDVTKAKAALKLLGTALSGLLNDLGQPTLGRSLAAELSRISL